MSRTFPDNIFFDKKDPKGYESLVNVLKGISLLYPKMGYCQGLNFIAATFVLYLNDEDSFYLLASILKYIQPIDYYIDLREIEKPLFVFEELMKKYIPTCYE